MQATTAPWPAPARTVEMVAAHTGRQPRPLTARTMTFGPSVVLEPRMVATNGDLIACAWCGNDDCIVAHSAILQLHNDSWKKRAWKTAGAMAAFAFIGFGSRNRQWAEVEVLQIECMRCGAIYVVKPEDVFGEGWIQLTEEDRKEFEREVG